MHRNATIGLAGFFSALRLDRVPPAIQHEGKRLILDTLGCLDAGARSELGGLCRSLAELFGGEGTATVAGAGDGRSLLGAAYANGRMANCMDFDETFPLGVHFGVGAVTAALAVGETEGLNGSQVLLAAIAGYELGARVAMAVGPMAKVGDDGAVDYADVWGVAAPVVMAAVGAAAKGLGLDAETTAQAYGIAGSNAPLPAGHKWATSVHLPDSKYCDAGWCTVTGVFAALSAARNATGFTTILDGDRGLARMCGAAAGDPAALTRGLGEKWLLADITYKPWPCCRFTHYPLTAFSRLIESHGLQADEVEQVIVRTGPLAASERFTNPRPLGFVDRQYSYPHLMAMAALAVPPGEWLDVRWADDPRVGTFKSRVRVERHARGDDVWRLMEGGQFRGMPGGVSVRARGRVLEADTDYALGDPWTPETLFDDARLFGKFRDLMAGDIGASMIEAVFGLEDLATVTPLMALLRVDRKKEQ